MQRISHSEDLLRLRDEGVEYSLVKGTVLVVEHVPYLNRNVELCYGTLIFPLTMSGESLVPPVDHTAFWKGEQPCFTDGSFISGLVSCPQKRDFGNGIVSDYFLSRKPVENNGKYLSYRDKVIQHIQMISTPAREQYPDDCKKNQYEVVAENIDLPFCYGDTNAARAQITGISEKLEKQKIAIVGLGGTGLYLLDYLAKCPVSEIHLYDDDMFCNHNAFRAPGAASIEVLNRHLSKVQYGADLYSNVKRNVIPHKEKITPDNISCLNEMDFVFLCIDLNSVRNMIAKYLADHDKPFIDSGLGLENINGHIVGQVRVTTAFSGHYDHLREAFGSSDDDDNVYASNIQVAELNSLAATMSVIKWKKLMGFYGNTSSMNDLNFVYTIQTNTIIKTADYGDRGV